MKDDYTKWQELCREFEDAREAFFRTFVPVNQKFTAIFQGTSHINPSNQELSEMDDAWERWQAVMRRMDEFVKVNIYQKHQIK